MSNQDHNLFPSDGIHVPIFYAIDMVGSDQEYEQFIQFSKAMNGWVAFFLRGDLVNIDHFPEVRVLAERYLDDRQPASSVRPKP
jgi:hypothetical protein